MELLISKNEKGISLIEVVVSIGIFTILATVVFQVYALIIKEIGIYRDRAAVSFLASQYMEIARNMPYSEIGTLSGNPNGNLPDLPNVVTITFGDIDYQVYYAVSYVDDPADGTILNLTDVAPNDYKQLKLYIKNTQTNTINSFFTNISPKGLEGLIGGGALYINVIDAVGQPVPGAQIHITNTEISPALDITRTSDAAGNWIEVALPEDTNSYHISVSRNGYSTDSTYPISESNPFPVKPDATILEGQVTQISFSIDKLSGLYFSVLDQICAPIAGATIGVKGAKLIGTPAILKFDNSYVSDEDGAVNLADIEWDLYTPGVGVGDYMIYGSFPIQQVNLLPDTEQNFRLILGPATTNSLLVVVKDSATQNPLEGAEINLTDGAVFNEDKISGGSIWSQQDWSGGSGQESFYDSTKYFEDDGNISTAEIPLGLRLLKVGGDYAESGYLVSSTFDTGTDQTVYTTLTWKPTSQDPDTFLKFQIATNNDNQTWDFKGPNNTPGTYYQTPGESINPANNNNRYVRYKVFLSTEDFSKTPVLTSVDVNYVSGCNTPGQVIFTNLEQKNYEATISMEGYQTQTINPVEIEGQSILEIFLVE
jgi:type II secretory pathway pseudopilin PulG